MDLRISLECAIASQLAYQVPGVTETRASGVPCHWVFPWDKTRCQGVVIEQEERFIVAYRGTSYEDVLTNTDCGMYLVDCGRVHSGFLAYAKCGFEHIQVVLNSDPAKPVIFTGHSLGGAAAVIAANLLLSRIKNRVLPVVTFGAPRVGDTDFSVISHYLTPHERWVHANDGVPRVPFLTQGYRHSGNEFYITTKGRIWPTPNPLFVFFDRWGFFRRSPFRWATDKIADHHMVGYTTAIRSALESEQ